MNQALKDERSKIGKTQKEVAEEVEISCSMMQHLEQGVKQGSKETMMKLAHYYDTSVDYLFFNKNIT